MHCLILSLLLSTQPSATQHSLDSQFLGEKRPFTVHLPAQSAKDYPVLFVLDGQKRTEQTLHITGYLNQRRKLPPMLVVSIPHTGQRSRDYLAFIDGKPNGGASRFGQFLEKELIPFIDSNYPTRPHRTLMGHSLSGAYVLYNLIQHPGIFQSHFAFSPSLHHTPKLIDLMDTPSTGYLYVNIGLQEFGPIVSGFRDLRKKMLESPPNPHVRFQEFPDDGHSTTPFIGLYSALKGQYISWYPSLERFKALADRNGVLQYYQDLANQFHYPVAPNFRDLESLWRYFYFRAGDPHTANAAVSLAKHFHPQKVHRGDFHFVDFWEQHGSSRTYPNSDPKPRNAFLNMFGYAYLQKDRITDAIYIFQLNARLYPQSANAWDSLGEAHERNADPSAARTCYQKAVDLAIQQHSEQVDHFRANLKRIENR